MKIMQISKTKTLSYLGLIAILFSVLLVTPAFAAKKTTNVNVKWAVVTFPVEEENVTIRITVWETKRVDPIGKTKVTKLRIQWYLITDPPPADPILTEIFDLDPKDFKWSMSTVRVSTELDLFPETVLLIIEWETVPPTMTDHDNDPEYPLNEDTVHRIWNRAYRVATVYLWAEVDGEVLELEDLDGRVGHAETTLVP